MNSMKDKRKADNFTTNGSLYFQIKKYDQRKCRLRNERNDRGSAHERRTIIYRLF